MATKTQASGVTVGEGSPSSAEGGGFLDDPYNMAMYVVLPSMIAVYGGCCFIYCMAKLNRYCKRKARRRARRRLLEKDSDGDLDLDSDRGHHSNPAVSIVDLTEPESPPVRKVAAPVRASGSWEASSPRPGVVNPGYTPTRGYQQDLHQQMRHLDDQLKAAFKLTMDEPKKPRSRPDVCAKSDENQKPVKKRGSNKMHFFVSQQ